MHAYLRLITKSWLDVLASFENGFSCLSTSVKHSYLLSSRGLEEDSKPSFYHIQSIRPTLKVDLQHID